MASSGQGLPTAALDYALPPELMATHPAEPRDAARMLVMWRSDPQRIEHRRVGDLPEYLRAGDALVFNNTAVAPARLVMRRATGGRVEGLFLEQRTPPAADGALPRWTVMLRSGGRISAGERLALLDRVDQSSDLWLRVIGRDEDRWIVELEGKRDTMAALERIGRTPLPPYILKSRHDHHESYRDDDDRTWYQTVYAEPALRKSVAAPTAGLHFTPELLARLESMGVRRIDVTLHVGPGTFKPVTAPTLQAHRMHAEWYEVSAEALRRLREAREAAAAPLTHKPSTAAHSHAPPRVIAVGTTAVRTLESLPPAALQCESGRPPGTEPQICGPISGMTDLLIAPPHDFRHLDGMLTNFHLPRSTLLALVAAMTGLERLLAVYRDAVARGYRFYSYGDAMLILP